MNHLSISSTEKRWIKSWFGFFLGLVCVGISIQALFKSFDLKDVLSTLGFLCFWYVWSQMADCNRSIKMLFKANDKPMNRFCTYLAFIALTLLITSMVVRFIN